MEERLRKHLIEATEWYKKGGRDEEEREKTGGGKIEGEEKDSLRAWKGWRIGRKMGKKYKKIHDKEESEGSEIRGVLFIQHTEKMVGKCKSTGIVYEVECITCKKKSEKENRELREKNEKKEKEEEKKRNDKENKESEKKIKKMKVALREK